MGLPQSEEQITRFADMFPATGKDSRLWVMRRLLSAHPEGMVYIEKLAEAGFHEIGIEPTRVYNIEDARTFLAGQGVDVDRMAPRVEGKFMSAFVRARKPGALSTFPA